MMAMRDVAVMAKVRRQAAERAPNLAGENRRPTLEEREPEAAVHLLVKHIRGGGPGDQTKADAAEGRG